MPLQDDDGKVIGLLGISIDITDRKKAEKLEIKNKLQKIKIDEQEEFKKFTARVVHDITSPLISLEYFAKYCKGLSEDYHATLMSIVTSIRNIAGDLLNRYTQDCNETYSEQEQHILVSLALLELIGHKRYQYKESKTELNYLPDPRAKFAFIKGDLSNFGRMISNLINNSVEAFENKDGTVVLSTKLEDERIKIIIKDNGKGMSQEFVNKINSNISVGTTKKGGHGIGLGQISDTLERYNGKLFVESKEGEGTTITITFSVAERPSWVTERIVLPKGGTVIIVDDEPSIHNIWKTLLKEHIKDFNLVFFTNCTEALAHIESLEDKNKIFLLSDLKFKNNSLHELNVILQNHMQERSLIVTNIHNNKMVYELIEQSGIRILPKQFMSDISIIVE
jgi:phosphoglycerate-specific signal transduction histidine kinase